eukprot:3264733-Amphidinium_carterae.1
MQYVFSVSFHCLVSCVSDVMNLQLTPQTEMNINLHSDVFFPGEPKLGSPSSRLEGGRCYQIGESFIPGKSYPTNHQHHHHQQQSNSQANIGGADSGSHASCNAEEILRYR